ncbi:MAG: transposase [Chloroflexi bacterium]|nr:transposase [Chloroflexota bacterium]
MAHIQLPGSLSADPHFQTYHRVLNRARWSSWALSRILPLVLVRVFVPAEQPVVVGMDDTIERRRGAKIAARGIYRDPVRSSKEHFVKTGGLRWVSMHLLARIPWAGRGLTRDQAEKFQRAIEDAKQSVGRGGDDNLTKKQMEAIRDAILRQGGYQQGGRRGRHPARPRASGAEQARALSPGGAGVRAAGESDSLAGARRPARALGLGGGADLGRRRGEGRRKQPLATDNQGRLGLSGIGGQSDWTLRPDDGCRRVLDSALRPTRGRASGNLRPPRGTDPFRHRGCAAGDRFGRHNLRPLLPRGDRVVREGTLVVRYCRGRKASCVLRCALRVRATPLPHRGLSTACRPTLASCCC